ncbi:hypothetical protein GCM10009858_16240 [Terrabacter carboxydivorans]|uniref:Uncharacterized protein n=1 Tax=Terrabacter carboxydivorans TaxID=619730 RepID=A0ABP5YDQ5_9MICO
MQAPSSVVRESMTRESVWRQNGQCTSGHLPFPETQSFNDGQPSRMPSQRRTGRPAGFVAPAEAGDGAGDDVGMTCA